MDSTVPAPDSRATLLSHVLEFAGEYSADERARLETAVTALLAHATEDELASVFDRVARDDYDFCYHPPLELVRKIHHVMSEVLLGRDSRVEGGEQLRAVAGESLMLLPNHLSYADANLIEVLLHRAGFDDLCARLCVVAGPKVYSEPWRRFASLCFGTIKTAQSSQVASGEAVMRPRDVARIARETIALTFERLTAGDAVLLFGEGTRSRDGALQPLLPAVARYCEHPDLVLVPLGIVGTEKFLGFADVRPQTTHAVLRVGTPVSASELVASCGGKRAEIVERIGRMIAATLPPEYRGAYASTR
jgi:1-acyl-sn-glycerol-3-phosphate acyltransferase